MFIKQIDIKAALEQATKIMHKILFLVKCFAALLLSPLLLFAVGALLVMKYEDQLLD